MTNSISNSPRLVMSSPNSSLKTNTNHKKKTVGERLQRQRSVRFSSFSDSNDDDENAAVGLEMIEPAFDLGDDDFNNIWWSQEELDESYSERSQTLKEFQDSKSDIKDSLSKLYKDCSSLSISQVMRTKAAKDILSVASSDARGLETKLSKWVSQRRKFHSKSVIEFCQQQQQQQNGIFDITSPVSPQTSRASELVARVLAHADALQAKSL